MNWSTQTREKSQLGQILLGKKLISEDQLDAAIREQGKSGRRLGEILADMKLITEAQVRGAIRRQRNLRMAAALATALLGPLHAYAAVTAAPAAAVSTRALGERSLRELSDEELGEIMAQGRDDDALRDQARQLDQRLASLTAMAGTHTAQNTAHTLPDGGVRVLGELVQVFNPLAMFLSADTTVRGVTYDAANSHAVVNKDGSITLRMPSTIGEIAFKNIRVGSAPGPSFGSVEIRDIDLRGTTISVKPR
ncbi:hypothetical protein SRABI118_03495 [Massilia sp. Bi118]|uniref:hypothetical protein n=1 Tax=Massilia sp. Bi118 TaxID=2822346 RepID=UPI001D78C3E1|nr:hypothetical protein [Massilia sp. Bi118]CAH0271166.1 hypothetical protein SRABI118_03495 [Massilia sp. Bi118]